MIFFFNSDGNLFRSVPENVYQGSNNVNKLYVVAPFANSATVSVAFRLPNSKNTSPALLTLTPATGELQGLIDSYNQQGLCVWALNIPNWVTNYAGNVTAQFYITGGGNLLATSTVQFPVIQGVAPTEPAENDLQSVLDAFSALLTAWAEFRAEIEDTVAGYYERNAIIAVMTVESTNLTVQLGTGTLTLDRIEWGDGTTDTEFSHTYATAGTYIVKIYATAWTYNDDDDLGVFDECYALDAVYLPDNLPAIPDYCFYKCTYLKKIVFANNTSIGKGAFYTCNMLVSIDLPNTVASIGQDAFAKADGYALVAGNLEKVYYKGTQTEWESIIGLSGAGFAAGLKVYYLDDGQIHSNKTDIDTIKTYIPSGTSASNKLQNESQVADAIAAAHYDYVSTTETSPQAVQGDFTIGGDAVIVGDLTVQGTEYINDVETIQSENTLIITNYSEEGAALTTLSGVVAITGEKENDEYPAIAVAVYDPADETLKLGTGTYADGEFTPDGDLQPLATRRESTDMIDGNLVKWNAEDNTLEDAGVAITAEDKTAWNNKQNALTFDDSPTQDSANPVKSGGVYTALSGKLDKSSTADRIYGTDGSGNQTTIPYSTAPNNGLIYRDANGRGQVNEPVANKDISNKKYVDDNLPVIQDWTV